MPGIERKRRVSRGGFFGFLDHWGEPSTPLPLFAGTPTQVSNLFEVNITGGRATVVSCDGDDSISSNELPLLTANIQTLSQLYTGVLKPSQAWWLGKLGTVSADEQFLEHLDKTFGNLIAYLNDFF